MIFIIFDNYAYQLGVKTVLAGILALLLGLIGFIMSVFALAIFWVVPAMRTRTPPYRKSNHRYLLYPGPNLLRGSVLVSSPELMHQVLPPVPIESNPPSLRRAASFPDLYRTPSKERPFMNERHVSFHVDAPEFYDPCLASSVTVNTPPSPPAIQRRWPPTPFSKRKSIRRESVPCSQTSSRSESDTVACNCSSRSTGVHDLPLKCFDERCECHGRQYNVGCDEHGSMNLPPVDFPCEGSASMRSPLTVSLRLPSVRKAFSGRRRPASVPPRLPAVISVGVKEQSEKQKPTSESLGKKLPSSPTFSTPGEVYHAEYVNPFKTKKPRFIKLEAPKSSLKSRFSFSGPWSSPKSAGSLPDLNPSTVLSTSVFTNSPSTFRRTFASRFIPSLKSPTISPLSPSTLGLPSPSSSPHIPVDVPQLKGKITSRPVHRTQPYGPPWNAVMPGHGHDLVDGALDDVLIKASLRRRSRGTESHREFKSLSPMLAPIDASEGEYSPEDLSANSLSS